MARGETATWWKGKSLLQEQIPEDPEEEVPSGEQPIAAVYQEEDDEMVEMIWKC
jgi:hypothetical protein